MQRYYIYRIDEKGEPKKKQETHAHNIDMAWCGNKNWYYTGVFLITNSNGSEAKIFILNREDEQ